MKKLAFLFSINLLFILTCIGQIQWNPVGNRGFTTAAISQHRFALLDTVPYVAFKDPLNSYRLSVMKYDGASWSYVGSSGFSPPNPSTSGSTNKRRIEFQINHSIPYVAFMDASDSNKVSVMKYNGSNWVYVGQKISPAYGNQLSMTFDDTTLYVSYMYTGGHVQVQKYEAGVWSLVGPASIAPVGGSPTSGRVTALAVLGGAPYLTTYAPTALNTFRTFRFDGTNWVDVSPPPGLNPGSYAYHFREHKGKLYLAFAKFYDSSRATLLEYDGTSWSSVGLSDIINSQDVRVAFQGNTPFLTTATSLSSPQKHLFHYDGQTWKEFGSFHSQTVSTDVAVDFLHDSIPYVSFSDGTVGARMTVVRFENDPPIIASIDSLAGCLSDFPDTVLISIVDEDTNSVSLTAFSDNQVLLPDTHLVFLDDTGATRRMVITPSAGQSGLTSIEIIATDNGTATDTINIKVNVFEVPGIALNSQNILCYGDANGSIVAHASGTAVPFSYVLNTSVPQTDSTFNNLSPGTYEITVIDSNGCQQSDQVALTEPDSIQILHVTIQKETLGNDGSLAILATGGTGVLLYSINGTSYQPNPQFLGLTKNSYTVYVRDSNACIDSTTIALGSTVGIADQGTISNYELYPNPNSGVLNLKRTQADLASLLIFDQLGKLHYEEKVMGMNQQIQLPLNLENGIYTVQLRSVDETFTQKLVLKR